jgi:hypothetical protein
MASSPDQFGPQAVAKRVRNRASTPSTHFTVMTVVVCADCGAEFQIGHRSNYQDRSLADRQAVWLADKFVWDHIQETKHPGSVDLPELPELIAAEKK